MSPLIIDMVGILTAEARQQEVATVTSAKAPELLAEFNRAWRALNEHVVVLRSHKLQAERALLNRRSLLMVDVIPGKLKEKGLASNDANREALITLDPEHIKLQDTVDQIEAVVEFLTGKMKAADNAFTSVKRIISDPSQYRGSNSRLSGDTGNSPSFRDPPPRPAPTREPGPGIVAGASKSGFSKARY